MQVSYSVGTKTFPMLVVPALLTILLTVALGFYVFIANPRNRAHQAFGAFNAFLALWTIKDLMLWDEDFFGATTAWWMPTTLVIALLMQYTLAVFAWVFPENHRTPKKKAAVLFAPGAVLVPATVLGLTSDSAAVVGGALKVSLNASGYLMLGYIFLIFGLGAAILLAKLARYRGSQEGRQLAAIIAAMAITVSLQVAALIALPLSGFHALTPFSSVLVLPGVLVFAYAILNLRLFSLQSVLDQFRLFPIGYKIALSVAAIAILSFVALQIPIAWWSFKDGMGLVAWKRYIVFSVLGALIPNLLLVLVVARSISRPLNRITVAAVRVAKGAYGSQVDLRRTNDEIGILADSFNEMSRKMRVDIERMRDITEQLMRTEKLVAIGTLSAGVAHEINNPLASVSSMIQILESRGGVDTETRETLRSVSEQIQRISEVARDMLDFARARPSVRVETDLHQSLLAAIRLAGFDRSFKSMEISTNLDRSLPSVVVDEDHMQQVFINLLLNAKDAMQSGGKIDISSSLDGGFVRIDVSDTGTGISLEDATRIFDPFFTTKPAGSGTGLGLAVCYGIVTAHGGVIEASKNVSGGATFTVKIPSIQAD